MKIIWNEERGIRREKKEVIMKKIEKAVQSKAIVTL